MLVDGFGRELTEIRVSLTDRCNFDCVYCHNEGLGDTRGPMAPQDEEMSTEEVLRVLSVAADLDVEAVKFTGGEPMLREDLEEIVRRAPESMAVSLTTNGSFLPDRAEGLVEAGLERVNVSQDAVDPEAFAEITKSGAYDRVIEGVDAALEAGLDPVKLNMVVFEGTAEYIPEMVDRVAERDGLRLQLIEYMPEIAGHPEWAIDIERVHEWLAERADRIETREMHDRKRYFVAGDEGEGMVEVVDPVENETFCENCHRVRVTHDGSLKGCLNRPRVHPMGELTEPEIRAAFREVVADRVPYYGEFMIEDDGEWIRNDEYVGEQLVVEEAPITADDD
ncbi:GTP 3',8-cyclase MoaA [Halapricum desulfuricans]|uniref:Probable GTP 3',8-cyclase n=1 Tax=Halapricum desulfuricans TaxID=2841257 RepID=A0A897N379_9EURY|nr:GTP 3',8-cyclase MoaA [Halapricum desulfuricans]QSG04766.1 Molybdenum cofactor biosynthesis enzyme [Halapricum desulfuricans]